VEHYGPGTNGFGPVSILVVTLLAIFVLAATWVGRRPQLLAGLWTRFRALPVALWADRNLGGFARSLAQRSSLSVVAGLALLIGFIVVAALATAFAEILEDVLVGDGINGVDEPAARWLAAHRDLWLTSTLKLLTLLGNSEVIGTAAVLVTAIVVWRSGKWLPAVLGLVGTCGIGLVIVGAKAIVGRSRPGSPFAVVSEDGFSFPSGHATGTAAAALICAWMLTRWVLTSWAARVAAWAVAIAVTGAVGFSRVYLGVHYVSDVVAGWFLGAAWAGSVMLVGTWWEDTSAGAGTRLTNAAPPLGRRMQCKNKTRQR
jgi:membrane-associated phospholipid phosphatase